MTTTTHNSPLSKLEHYSLSALGHMHLEHERFDEARAIFEGLSALEPQDAYTWRALAQVAKGQKKYELAAQYLKHCADLAPRDASHRVALVELHLLTKNRDAAWAALSPLKERALTAAIEQDIEQRQALLRARVLLREHFGI